MTVERTAFRVTEAAESLGLSVGYVRTLIKTGRLRTVAVGSVVLVPAEALRDFLHRQTFEDRDTEESYNSIRLAAANVCPRPVAVADLPIYTPHIDERSFRQALAHAIADGSVVVTHIAAKEGR